MRRLVATGVALALVIVPAVVWATDEGPAWVGAFDPTGAVAEGRNGHTATLLPDGRVLVIGGGAREARRSTEVWDPASASFEPAGSLKRGRKSHTATALPDGRVLVVGGGRGIEKAEVWDPATASFDPAGRLAEGRNGHTATLLPDGRVLVIGGWKAPTWLASAEAWDPDSKSFAAVGSLSEARVGHTATLLPDGRVLVVGGHGANEPAPEAGIGGYPDERRASAEIWDPETGSFGPAGTLAEARSQHTATLLSDGRVLIVGGWGRDGDPVSAEVWDPAGETFSPAGTLAETRSQHTATLLVDGRVLVVGGMGPDSLASAEVWDPASSSFSPTGGLARGRSWHTATALPDGRVLVVGGLGRTVSSSTEIWDPGALAPRSSTGVRLQPTRDPEVFMAVDLVGDSRSPWDTFSRPVRQIAVGPDGTPWALDGEALWQVGAVESHSLPIDPITLDDERVPAQPFDLAVTPDGTPWIAAVRPTATETPDGSGLAIRWDNPVLWSYDGETWTEAWTDPAPPWAADRPGLFLGGRIGVTDLDAAPDGTLYGLQPSAEPQLRATVLSVDGDFTATREVEVDPGGEHPVAIAVTDDGDVWVGGHFGGGDIPIDPGHGFLVRIPGESATPASPITEGGDPAVAAVAAVAAGPDGSLWALTGHGTESYLARLDESGWTTYSLEEELPSSASTGQGGMRLYADRLAVSPDGTVWMILTGTERTGVASFDGSTWTRYLRDKRINDLAIASDGSVWTTDSEAIYVISP
jgi:hypothetical protein